MAATIETMVCNDAEDKSHLQSAGVYSKPIQEFVNNDDEDRCVISEYHDGGSPCGVFMLRQGPWKLIYFTEYNPPILFNLKDDPQELVNLAEIPEYQERLNLLTQQLFEITNPEETNQQAFNDQAILIDKLGGPEVINGMKTFNHTPLE